MKADASKTKSEDELQGKPRPEPGQYLAACKTAEEYPSNKEGKPIHASKFEFEVLEGTVPGQDGKEFDHMVWREAETGNETPEYQGKMLRLCMALGLIKPGEVRDINIDQECPGRVCVIKLEKTKGKGKNEGKEYLNVGNFGYDVWSVSNKEVAAIVNMPKVQQILKALGGDGGAAGGAANSGGSGNGGGNGGGQSAAGKSEWDSI